MSGRHRRGSSRDLSIAGGVRQEVVNVLLAQLLSKRGFVAAPETGDVSPWSSRGPSSPASLGRRPAD